MNADLLFAAFEDELEKIALKRSTVLSAKRQALDQARQFMDSAAWNSRPGKPELALWPGKDLGTTSKDLMQRAAERRIRQAKRFGATEEEIRRTVRYPAVKRHRVLAPMTKKKPASSKLTKAVEDDFRFAQQPGFRSTVLARRATRKRQKRIRKALGRARRSNTAPNREW